MKKTILLFLIFSIFACSSDSSDPVNPQNTVATLDGAVITPVNSSAVGYGQQINYILTKEGATLDNLDYTWSVSDTLRGRISNSGEYFSRVIGQTNVAVRDDEGNTLTANVVTNAKVTDIPDAPYLKWGATNAEIQAANISSNSGWALLSNQYPYLNPVFKKGNHAVRYYISGSTGLYRAEFMYNYSATVDSGGVSDSNKLVDYCNERFIEMKMDDPHYYGYKRWWYIGLNDQKVYVNIVANQNQTYYILKYAEN